MSPNFLTFPKYVLGRFWHQICDHRFIRSVFDWIILFWRGRISLYRKCYYLWNEKKLRFFIWLCRPFLVILLVQKYIISSYIYRRRYFVKRFGLIRPQKARKMGGIMCHSPPNRVKNEGLLWYSTWDKIVIFQQEVISS